MSALPVTTTTTIVPLQKIFIFLSLSFTSGTIASSGTVQRNEIRIVSSVVAFLIKSYFWNNSPFASLLPINLLSLFHNVCLYQVLSSCHATHVANCCFGNGRQGGYCSFFRNDLDGSSDRSSPIYGSSGNSSLFLTHFDILPHDSKLPLVPPVSPPSAPTAATTTTSAVLLSPSATDYPHRKQQQPVPSLLPPRLNAAPLLPFPPAKSSPSLDCGTTRWPLSIPTRSPNDTPRRPSCCPPCRTRLVPTTAASRATLSTFCKKSPRVSFWSRTSFKATTGAWTPESTNSPWERRVTRSRLATPTCTPTKMVNGRLLITTRPSCPKPFWDKKTSKQETNTSHNDFKDER